MTSPPRDPDRLREWAETWRRVGPLLAQIRDRELAETDTTTAIRALSDAFRAAGPPLRPTSGLVDQQRYFVRLRR